MTPATAPVYGDEFDPKPTKARLKVAQFGPKVSLAWRSGTADIGALVLAALDEALSAELGERGLDRLPRYAVVAGQARL